MDEHPMQASPAQEAPPRAGLFEDIIDAFINPRALFARQRDPKFWGALIVFAILSGILLYAAGSAIAPVLQLEAMRALEGNPAIEPGTPPPAFMTNPAFQAGVALVVGPVFVLILGVFVWLIGKFFGFAGSVGHGLAIAVFANYPRLLTPVAEVLQSLFIDVNALTSRLQLSLGPVRFLDPETTSANLRGVASRFDLTILWATVLIGIGLAVTGRMSAGRAAAAAAMVWLLATAIAATGLGLG
ncbi:MAG TPA: YIP1 family protein [Longimicrobiales bacterium]|nr:YIP1 family protein [Longimicrobiales bacterium]